MSKCCNLLLSTAILSCCSTLFAQPAAPPPDALPAQQNMARRFENQIRQFLEMELRHFARVGKVGEDKVDAIRNATADLVKAEATSMADDIGRGVDPGRTMGLSDEIQERFNEVAQKTLSDASAFEAYSEDKKLREKLLRTAAQRSLVIALDGIISLSKQQEGAIARTLMSSWNDDWNPIAFAGSQIGGFIMFQQLKGFEVEKLKPALRESQYMVLKGITDMDTNQFRADRMGIFRLEADQFVQMAAEEIGELCNLSAAQADKLSTSFQNAADAAIQKKEEAFILIRQREPGQPQADMKAMEALSTPIPQLIKKSDAWDAGISDTLDEKQQALVRQREELREKRAKSATAAMIANSFFGMQLSLSGKQIQALTSVFVDNVGPGFASGMQAQMEQLTTIPEPLFKDILDDDQLIKLSNLMGQIRQQMAMMKQKPQPQAVPVE